MGTSYPGALDTFTNPTSSDQLNSPSHAGQHADANDAIEAIEGAIGVKYGARAKATRTTDQSIPTGTDTLIAFTSEAYDTDGFHDNATNNDRVTIPSGMGGLYLIAAQVVFDSSTAGNSRNAVIYKNGLAGTSLAEQTIPAAAGGSFSQRVNLSVVAPLVAGDYLGVGVFHNAGANLNVEGTSTPGLWLQVVKIA